MSEIKLFAIDSGAAKELTASASALEKPLQLLFEQNLDVLLGVRFLASEHSTGAVHAGRIDSLGIDENGLPVIVEYKRSLSENVVSQGLYYLDWLMDHKADFKLLVLDRFGAAEADKIDWSGPRLICVASDFTKFDEHAIRQINRNIDLVRYKRFGESLLALELATTVSASSVASLHVEATDKKSATRDKPVAQAIDDLDDELRLLYEELRRYILDLGDDVNEKPLKLYVAFRRIRNFATVCVQKKALLLYLHIDPDVVEIDSSIMRDVRSIGHWGTGDVELTITDRTSLQQAFPLIERTYGGS